MAYNVGWHSLKFGGLFFRGHQGRASIENPNFNYSTLNDALSNTPAQTSFPFGRPAYREPTIGPAAHLDRASQFQRLHAWTLASRE